MQIPVYQQQINLSGSAPMPRADAMPVSSAAGQALSNAAAGLQQAGAGLAHEASVDAKLLREQEEQDGKAWAGNVLSNAQLQWQQNMKERQEQATGAAAGFTPQVIKDFDDYTEKTIATAPTPAAKRYLQQHLAALRTQVGGQAINFEAGARVSERVKNVAGSIDNWSNVVYSDPSKAPMALASIEQTMPEVGPELRDKLMRQAKETIPYFAASGTLERAGKTGDLEGVRQTRTWLESPEAETMDPAKRSSLITKAYGYENGIVASQERARAKAENDAIARENAGTDAFNKAFDLWSQGRYFSQEYIAETSAAVTGTSVEKPFRELVQSQSKMAGFASMSLPQQASELERQRAAGSTPGIGVSPVQQAVMQQQERTYQASLQAYKDNPWKAAQERGVITDAPVVSIPDVQTAQNLIATRMRNINAVEIKADRRVSPLQPPEAEQLGKIVRALPPDQQSSALAGIGAAVGDADRVSDLAKQMSDKDKTLGIAMAYANARTTAGRYTSEMVLRGERAIKDGVVKVDSAKESGWRAEIAKEVGDATLNQDVRSQWIDAAFLVQAAIASEDGGTDIKRAVNLATGGIREQRDGTKIPRPYGMNDDTFTQRLGAMKPEDLAPQTRDGLVYVGKQAVPLAQFVSQIPQAALVHAGQGKYAVRAGTGLVTTSPGAGKPLIIEVRQ